MSTPVSVSWLSAYAMGYPLFAPAAFESAAMHLPDRGIAAAAELDLVRESRGRSIASLRLLLRDAWFPRGTRRVSLRDHVRRVAQMHLRVCNRRTIAITDVESAMRWRRITHALPPDLLCASLASSKHVSLLSSRPAMRDEHIPTQELALLHVHLGAALSFDDLWLATQRALVRNELDLGRLPEGPEVPFGGADEFHRMLFRAALARWVLGAYVSSDPAPAADVDDAFVDRIARASGVSRGHAILFGAIHALLEPRETTWRTSTAAMAKLLYALARLPHRRAAVRSAAASICPLRRLEDLSRSDPLHPAFPGTYPELRFTQRTFAELPDDDTRRRGFSRLFWQYQRVRCQLYSFIVQRPGAEGLHWFQRHYRRIRAFSAGVGPIAPQLAIRLERDRAPQLNSLELRSRPQETWEKQHEHVAALVRASGGVEAPRLGLILHFVKAERQGRAATAEPGGANLFRYSAYFRDRSRRVRAVQHLFARRPRALFWLRGIDVASDELAMPTWIFRPLFDRLREAAQKHGGPVLPEGVEPLRATFHAGEDFRALHEGIRRVHELVDFEVLKDRDRVGHALALGVAPSRVHAPGRFVFQPAEERMWDLLWEIELCAQGHIAMSLERFGEIAPELGLCGARGLVQEIFGEPPPTLEELRVLRQQLFSPDALRSVGFPSRRIQPPPGRTLLARYLTDGALYHRCVEPHRSSFSEAQHDFLQRAQTHVCSQLRAREISIECNPSSNLLIGDYGGLAEHPAFVLRNKHRLAVTINDDDPATFATNLADEIAYIEAAGRGLGTRAGRRFVPRALRDGVRARFTLDESRTPAMAGRIMPPRERHEAR